MIRRLFATLLLATFSYSSLAATEYFVRVDGSDAHDGLTRETAFATIQKGVDALEPGDTLTIGPGEYHESVARADLGGMEAETVIRAEIPGTAVLRGDVPAPPFRKLEGHGFVYVADFHYDGEVQVVNELDTLTVFQSRPNISEVEFTPGTFHQDREKGRLYISPSDGRPAGEHLYSVSVIPDSGLHLTEPVRVVIEGLGVAGFNTADFGPGGRGIYLTDARGCVVRDGHTWMNGWGVEVTSSEPETGGNVIERCVAWANDSPFENWRRGGLNFQRHRGDVIRDSIAFLNAFAGVYLRSDSDAETPSYLSNNLTWGNRWDNIIKGNPDLVNVTERSVGGAYSTWSESPRRNHPVHCLVLSGRMGDPSERTYYSSADIPLTNIWIEEEEEPVDLLGEFADPDNRDYRLQATSRFRGTGPNGVDRGPFPYQAKIFFVSPDGDDDADGLSVGNAWRTVARGLRDLRAGDTLYLSPGTYHGDIEARLQGAADEPVSIRGRGVEPVVLEGAAHIADSANAAFERLHFAGPVRVADSADIAFDHCAFTAGGTALEADAVVGLRVTHCAFSGFGSAAISLSGSERAHLSGNLFENQDGVAVRTDALDGAPYADYNAYREPGAAWEVGDRTLALDELGGGLGRHAQAIPADFDATPGVASLHHRPPFAALGPMGMPFGPYRGEPRREKLRLTREPAVHSLSATTANIEWKALLPSRVYLAWGDTPEMKNRDAFDTEYLGSYSLTGLEPGQTYYFQIQSLEESLLPVSGHATSLTATILAEPTEIDSEILTFTTPEHDPEPKTYYVAPDGDDSNTGLDRENAWGTVQHAAGRVNVGDTVMLAGGSYEEQVRVRVTGAPHAPITFRSVPGEKVVFKGPQLSDAFAVSGKGHLRFDGMYFLSMRFNIYRAEDIEITRVFAGRYDRGYPPDGVLLYALHSDGLLVKNSVVLSGKSGPTIQSCTNVRIENSVFFRNMISQLSLELMPGASAAVVNSIFTDGLVGKSRAPMMHLARWDSFEERNNCFFPRPERWDEKTIVWLWSDEAFERHRIGRHMGEVEAPHPVAEEILRLPFDEMEEYLGETDSIRENPEFLGAADVPAETEDGRPIYPVDRINRTGLIPMNEFFATNPELVERGIGLQPEAFDDFHFNQE